jgi:hypothetical protein
MPNTLHPAEIRGLNTQISSGPADAPKPFMAGSRGDCGRSRHERGHGASLVHNPISITEVAQHAERPYASLVQTLPCGVDFSQAVTTGSDSFSFDDPLRPVSATLRILYPHESRSRASTPWPSARAAGDMGKSMFARRLWLSPLVNGFAFSFLFPLLSSTRCCVVD